jgi:hypothetical protein
MNVFVELNNLINYSANKLKNKKDTSLKPNHGEEKMSLVTDILLISSAATFIAGFLALFVKIF